MKVKVETLVVGPLATNCHLAIDEKTSEAIIIDPADDYEVIVARINDLELTPVAIIATHGHFDHLVAVNELKLAYKVPFYLTRKDESMLSWMRKSSIYFTGNDCGPAPKIDKYLKEKDKINFGESTLSVINSPGHSPGGISLYCKEGKVLFTGDTVFADGAVGRTDLPYSSLDDLKKSIKVLLKLPKGTRVLSGHGRETSVEEINRFNLV